MKTKSKKKKYTFDFYLKTTCIVFILFSFLFLFLNPIISNVLACIGLVLSLILFILFFQKKKKSFSPVVCFLLLLSILLCIISCLFLRKNTSNEVFEDVFSGISEQDTKKVLTNDVRVEFGNVSSTKDKDVQSVSYTLENLTDESKNFALEFYGVNKDGYRIARGLIYLEEVKPHQMVSEVASIYFIDSGGFEFDVTSFVIDKAYSGEGISSKG